ncbi:MAG TPA: C-terminal binding protein [Chloroflexota bacterium]|nr:C-terminal binding protein [Chloroflexota bacterium]
MAAFKVVIADQPAADHDVEAATLAASGLRLEAVWLAGRDADRVAEYAADADALVMSWTPVTRLLITQLRRCRVIARFGIGVDMIDLDAATERGILVCNTATYCLDEVSNHAMGLLLMLNRGLLQDIDAVRAGGWFRASGTPPRRLHGQRLGLVGLGNIGRLVARKARGFGLDVVAYDPYLRREQTHVDGISLIDLDELLESADIVSVHCPLNDSTRHLLGARELGRMKASAFLINTSRGPVVDQAALTSALAERRLAGAGLDVFETEPLPVDDPLRALDNVILTPHSASWSVESSAECRRVALEHVVTVLRGGVPTDVVNRAVLERVHAG